MVARRTVGSSTITSPLNLCLKLIKMKNKRGILRIIEAFIAVLLVAGVLIFVVNNKSVREQELNTNIYRFESSILNEVSQSNDLRSRVLSDTTDDMTYIQNFVSTRSPQNYITKVVICGLDVPCPLPANQFPQDKQVYSQSVAVTSNVSLYVPRQVKIFMWKK